MKITCKNCKKEFKPRRKTTKFCSRQCHFTSKEWRSTLSVALQGNKKPPRTIEHRRKLGLVHKGEKQRIETIQKRVEKIRGENSGLWKGDNVGYRALHYWVVSELGQPNECSECGKIGYGRQMHWANRSHEYKRELSDWLRLCVVCHKKYDHAFA